MEAEDYIFKSEMHTYSPVYHYATRMDTFESENGWFCNTTKKNSTSTREIPSTSEATGENSSSVAAP